jgi:hypothetical protein
MNSETLKSQDVKPKGEILTLQAHIGIANAHKFLRILEEFMRRAFPREDFKEYSYKKVQFRGGTVRRPHIPNPRLKDDFNKALKIVLKKCEAPKDYTGDIYIELNFTYPTGEFIASRHT